MTENKLVYYNECNWPIGRSYVRNIGLGIPYANYNTNATTYAYSAWGPIETVQDKTISLSKVYTHQLLL